MLNNDCDNDGDANDADNDVDTDGDVNDEEEEEATQALSRQLASLKKSQNLRSISSSGSRVVNWDCHPTQSSGTFFSSGSKNINYKIFW